MDVYCTLSAGENRYDDIYKSPVLTCGIAQRENVSEIELNDFLCKTSTNDIAKASQAHYFRRIIEENSSGIRESFNRIFETI